jgi:hypothetical protein
MNFVFSCFVFLRNTYFIFLHGRSSFQRTSPFFCIIETKCLLCSLDPDDPEGIPLISETPSPQLPKKSRPLSSYGLVVFDTKDVKLRSVPVETQTTSTHKGRDTASFSLIFGCVSLKCLCACALCRKSGRGAKARIYADQTS